MTKVCGDCVFFLGCARYEGKTRDSGEAETCRAYLSDPRHGEWLIEEEEDGSEVGSFRPVRADEGVSGEHVVCSECRCDAIEDSEWSTIYLTRFCPHCGAVMDNWQSEEQQAANEERWEEERKAKDRAEYEAYWATKTPEERAAYEAFVIAHSTGPVNPATFEDADDDETEGLTPDIVISELGG